MTDLAADYATNIADARTALATLDAAIATLRARGVAVRLLLCTATADRRHRAASVTVAWAAARDNGDRLVAKVVGTDEYAVTITLGAVGFNCTCPDHNRTGPCKHVVAVANRFLVNHARPEWLRLATERAEVVAHISHLEEVLNWEDPHPEDEAEVRALRAAEHALGCY